MESPFSNPSRKFKPQDEPQGTDSEVISNSNDSLDEPSAEREVNSDSSPGVRKLHNKKEETEAEKKKRQEIEQKRADLSLYMCRIDNAYKTAKFDTEKNLSSLKQDIRKNPRRYENEWRNLQSWANDLEEVEKRKEELKQIEADQVPQ